MAGAPWYKDGLKFQCTQCGDCCSGAPGFVWVNAAEIAELARLKEMSVPEFEAKYVRIVGIRKSLVEYDNGDCVFFDPQKRCCTVYEARPRQCRTWPFWDSNIRTPDAWEETRAACPGCGRGQLIPLEEVERQAAVIRL